MKIALITGVTGQDGSYLSEFLLEKDMRCMASSAVLQQSGGSVLNTFGTTRASICTMAI